MSPEATKILEEFKKNLKVAGGALSDLQIADLKTQGLTALENNDFEQVAKIAATLSSDALRRGAFSAELEEATGPLQKFLADHNLGEININFTSPGTKTQALLSDSTPGIGSPRVQEVTAESKVPSKESNYIPSARQTVALALLDVKKYKTEESVYVLMLKDGKKTPKDLGNAKHYYETTVYEISSALSKAAEITGSKTVTELIDNILNKNFAKKIRDPKWKLFYEEAGKLFGSKSVEEFTEQVIERFYTKKKKEQVKKEVEIEVAKTKNLLPNMIPGRIEPIHELRLSTKLLSPGAIEKIEEKLLKGKKVEAVAKENGWGEKKSLVDVLENSRMTIARKRNNVTPTIKEDRDSAQFIYDFLVKLSISKRGWHMIKEDYKSFKLLFYVINEFKANSNNPARDIYDILYAQKEYALDTHGFIGHTYIPGAD